MNPDLAAAWTCGYERMAAWTDLLDDINNYPVADADQVPVGVDVEPISEKALKNSAIFMSASEQRLAAGARKENMATAVRIWSVKEAVAKAADISLAEAWHRVRVSASDEEKTVFRLNGRGPMTAGHARVDDHVLTWFSNREGA